MSLPQPALASVVVNNYNYARFLGQAIDSALAQSYRPLEVIVVDDGSTDGSRAVLERYDHRIIAICKENGGQASAFNAGFAVAKGAVVLFLDADDALLPDAVARAVESFEPGVVKVHWPLWEMDSMGVRTGKLQPERALEEGDLKQKSIHAGPVAGNSPPTSGNAWSRALLEQVLPMPEEQFRINADGYLLTLAWIYGEVRALTEPLGLYRLHGENLFAAGSAGQKQERHLEKYAPNCEALAVHLRRMGIEPRPVIWKLWKGVYDAEVEAAVKAELAAAIPPEARFILIDQDAWASWFTLDSAGGRRLPFLPAGGRPADDIASILELERLRSSGAGFIAFSSFTFGWLDQYAQFAAHLRNNYRCVAWNDLLGIFDLRPPAGRGPAALVSIIVNNYNYGRFLGEAIDSALTQTYAPLEVVVVDDGSTDESRTVIESYGNRVVSVLKPNGGQGSAFNAGFAAAHGEVVIFLDADDVLLPQAVERALELFEPGVVKVHWPLVEIDTARNPTGRLMPTEALAEGDLRELTIRNGTSGSVSSPTSGNAWTRSFLATVLPVPEAEHRIGADAYLFGVAPAYGLIRRLAEPHGLYRIHDRNYWQGTPFEQRLRHGLLTAEQQWRVLGALATAQAITPDLAQWRQHSYFHQLHAAWTDIEALVDQGQTFILVDDGRWAIDPVVAGRRVLPFLERSGCYWGVPENDTVAISELNRLRTQEGAVLIAFAWPAFWWLDHYREFAAHLRAAYQCRLANQRLIVFDLLA